MVQVWTLKNLFKTFLGACLVGCSADVTHIKNRNAEASGVGVLSSAWEPGLLPDGVTFTESNNTLEFNNVPSGRWVTFPLRLDGQKISGVNDEVCEASDLGSFALFSASGLHLDLGIQMSAGQVSFDCLAGNKSFRVVVNHLRSENQLVSGSSRLSHGAETDLGVLSADGSTVVFRRSDQILHKELSTGRITLVSKNSDGEPGDDASSYPHVSADGRYVIFESAAENFVTGASGSQIYLRDMQNLDQAPVLVSSLDSTEADQTAFQGADYSGSAQISADGRYAVFSSASTNFVTGGSGQQIYLKDMQNPADPPVLVSSFDSTQADQSTFQSDAQNNAPSLSADGRFVVFDASASNLATGGSGQQIYLKDMQNPATAPVLVSSLDSSQADQTAFLGDQDSSQAHISADGRYVVFGSGAENFVTGGTDIQIYRKDMQNLGLAPVLVSSLDSSQVDQTAFLGNSVSQSARVSADGRYVVFHSYASNFVTGADGQQIYLKDMQSPSAAPIMISSGDSTELDQTSFQGDFGSWSPNISHDGRSIVFQSYATNFGTKTYEAQVFLKDTQNLSVAPLHITSPDSSEAHQVAFTGNDDSENSHMSADGRFVVFEAYASNLVTGAYEYQIYLRDLQGTSPMVLVSSVDSTQADQTAHMGLGDSDSARISADGRYVVFRSDATNFVTGMSGNQIFRKDTQNPALAPAIVSSLDSSQANQSAHLGDADSAQPQISADGRYVVFESASSNFVTGASGIQIYLKDMQNPATPPVLISSLDSEEADQTAFQGDGDSSNPQMSSDGRYVVFESYATNFVTGSGGLQIYRKDLQNLDVAPLLVSSLDSSQGDQSAVQGDASSSRAAISSDGSFVVFQSDASNFVTGANGTQIYRKDLQNPALAPLLVSSLDSSAVDQSAEQGNAISHYAQLSADGRFVVFVSGATNFVAGVSGSNQIYVKDLQNLAVPPVLISTRESAALDQTAHRANGSSWSPQISSDARYITYESRADNLISGTVRTQVYRKDLSLVLP